MQYFRNSDDQHSDPLLIGTQYQVGRNAYFEVALTLAELADANTSLRGGNPGSPDVAQAVIAGSGGGTQGGCPALDQYVAVGTNHDDLRCIKAKSLAGRQGEISLYNPITRNFNLLVDVEIIEQPLFKIVTSKGFESIVSQSHKIIVNTADLYGMPLIHYGAGRECVSFDQGKLHGENHWNIHIDNLIEISDAGIGSVVKISLQTEFIYACGSKKWQFVVSHNRKNNSEIF